MVNPDPPWPPWSMGEVLRTSQLSNKLVEDLLSLLRLTKEDGFPLSTEKFTVWVLHAFQGYLASRLDPIPRLDMLSLLSIDQYGTVYLLH